ncbi:MAG: hypothetical protein H6741_35475 [Alphaproteobacteria bacterium]|nr:hypothetical protein [Alphaproteobacteria bacterium]
MYALVLALACSQPKIEGADSDLPVAQDSGGVEADDSAEPADDTGEPVEDDTGEPATDDSGEPTDDSGEPVDTGEPDEHPMTPPEWPTYSEGACPTLVSSNDGDSDASLNTGFFSGELEREFRLVVPEGYDGSRPLPLVIGWHWLNASAGSFVRESDINNAVNELDFIAVFPESLGDQYLFDWPFFETYGAEVEHLFLDDMLACIGEQYNVDPYQVHGLGVSAGALWITYVSTTEHVDRFASIMSLSGGLGEAFGVWNMAWEPQDRKFPAFVLNGGPNDWLAVDFYASSHRYRDELLADGHFVVECEHDQGHAVPPFVPPEGHTTFYAMWQFMFDHPYDTPAGYSPWQDEGLPDGIPDWCQIAEP